MSSSKESDYKTLLQESLIGVKTGVGHAKWFVQHLIGDIEAALSKPFQIFNKSINQPLSSGKHHRTRTSKKASSSSSASEEPDASLQVIGVGFGRTGTVSNQWPMFYKYYMNSVLRFFSCAIVITMIFYSCLQLYFSPSFLRHSFCFSMVMFISIHSRWRWIV
mmetsp:Transcript_5607/g.10648  ORF Transcript_5607/g.10648 Transcript_5607/m.10648 type:complete len:163 (+) Transcript_5607:367-855(+)